MADFVNTDYIVNMDPDIKAQWVNDLRSGEIKQGKTTLCREDTGEMCCLGVLSELAYQAGVVGKESMPDTLVIDREQIEATVTRYGDSSFSLTASVAEWAGVKTEEYDLPTLSGILPFRDSRNVTVYLDVLNDTGFTFDQIADLIECWY